MGSEVACPWKATILRAGGRGDQTVEQATAKAGEIDQQLVAVRSQSGTTHQPTTALGPKAEARLSELRDSLQRAEMANGVDLSAEEQTDLLRRRVRFAE